MLTQQKMGLEEKGNSKKDIKVKKDILTPYSIITQT
jgi:hypothetical protein